MLLVADTLNVFWAVTVVGVPEMIPVPAFKIRPEGKAGVTV